jgi:hypothetical protein
MSRETINMLIFDIDDQNTTYVFVWKGTKVANLNSSLQGRNAEAMVMQGGRAKGGQGKRVQRALETLTLTSHVAAS